MKIILKFKAFNHTFIVNTIIINYNSEFGEEVNGDLVYKKVN